MPSTYEPIATTTVSGSSTSTISFSSIASTYTDLYLVTQGGLANSGGFAIRFNGDTGTNYSRTFLKGNGTSATSGRGSNEYPVYCSSDGTNQVNRFAIMNYSNTTTYKTMITRGDEAANSAITFVVLWRSTSAINQVEVICPGTNFNSGFTATLYGIKSA